MKAEKPGKNLLSFCQSVLDYISSGLVVSCQIICAVQHSIPQYSGVYFQLRQNVPLQTAVTGRRLNLKDMAVWTLELRHHRHFQTLGSPSKYFQRHREQGCAYSVKEMRFWRKHNTSQLTCKSAVSNPNPNPNVKV